MAGEDGERPRRGMRADVYWARKRVAAKFACLVEGHIYDPEEIDDEGMAPCSRCDRWVYPT